ncbi:MAG: ATP-binding response regulator [Anaerolineae bacterium]
MIADPSDWQSESDEIPSAAQTPAVSALLADLLQPALRQLGVVAVLASYVWLLAEFQQRHPEPALLPLLPPLLLGTSAGVSLIAPRRSASARLLLTGGLVVSTLVEMSLGDPMAARLLSLASVLVAGAILSPPAAVATFAGIASYAVLVADYTLAAWPIAADSLVGVLLVCTATRGIAQALVRAELSETRAWEQAREAMRRRGELRNANKALKDMYALLERTNHELEIARREAEEARTIKARFAANVSHELRTPLNLILGFSRMMYRSPEVYGKVRWTPELRLDIHEIYRASEHLLGMVDDVLDLSRIEAQRLPIKREATDVRAVIDEAVSTVHGLLRGSAVELHCHTDALLPAVLADRTRIRQVLLNLLNNAIRFTDAGHIDVSARPIEGEVEIAVADTGVGIAPDDQAIIFDEFAQADIPIMNSRGGAGLGLALCKQVVQLHGGRIAVESEVGKGSTFRFTIPVLEGGKARSRLTYQRSGAWQPPLPANPLGKSLIILAPDEGSGRIVARHVDGYRSLVLTSLDHFPEVVEVEHPAGVVLVQDPLTGSAIASAAQVWDLSRRPDLGVIECDLPMEALAKRYLGIAGYLVKPIQPEDLIPHLGDRSQPPVSCLIVDDDPGFRSLIQRAIGAISPHSECRDCAADQALSLLREQRFDWLLLDLMMPGHDGLSLLRDARQHFLLEHTRVIVITGAPYVEELARRFPARLALSKRSQPPSARWFGCIKSLLDGVPPDYSLPAACPAPLAGPLAAPAS